MSTVFLDYGHAGPNSPAIFLNCQRKLYKNVLPFEIPVHSFTLNKPLILANVAHKQLLESLRYCRAHNGAQLDDRTIWHFGYAVHLSGAAA